MLNFNFSFITLDYLQFLLHIFLDACSINLKCRASLSTKTLYYLYFAGQFEYALQPFFATVFTSISFALKQLKYHLNAHNPQKILEYFITRRANLLAAQKMTIIFLRVADTRELFRRVQFSLLSYCHLCRSRAAKIPRQR